MDKRKKEREKEKEDSNQRGEKMKYMRLVTWVMLSLQCFWSSWILSLNFTISSRFFLTSSGGNSGHREAGGYTREQNFCIDEGEN